MYLLFSFDNNLDPSLIVLNVTVMTFQQVRSRQKRAARYNTRSTN